MAKRKNKPVDVFQHIDMHGGDYSVCWEWQGYVKTKEDGSNPRPYISLSGSKKLVYRVVFDIFHPDQPLTVKEVVRHTCDNSICCNPTHLERGTHEENMRDMRERQRHGLTHHAVKAIKRLLANGVTHVLIAERFGVSRETITAINNDVVYSDVKDEDI